MNNAGVLQKKQKVLSPDTLEILLSEEFPSVQKHCVRSVQCPSANGWKLLAHVTWRSIQEMSI